MQILVDTNILIKLEGNHQIDDNTAKFYQLAIASGSELCYHPSCIDDLKNDGDNGRKNILQSILKKYSPMKDPGAPTDDFINTVGHKKGNDGVDNKQLYQVYKKYVDYLVTEDKGIHEKARKINLQNKVLTISQGLKLLDGKDQLIVPSHPLLIDCSVRDIEPELNTEFFDSLREGYPEFNEWFQGCAQKNRKCYVLRTDQKISALLIYNRENENGHEIPNVKGDAMKMCTFKVDKSAYGYKLGELFLNKMFQMCIDSGIKQLYLTVYAEHKHLIELLSKYGFTQFEIKNKKGATELRMLKSLVKTDYTQNANTEAAHPFYRDDTTVNKFIIPIRPEFYGRLFKDSHLRTPGLFDKTLEALNEIEGSTISKAYLCKSRSLAMKEGDLLFFYSSQTGQFIEPIGIVDKIVFTSYLDEIKNLVRKRTVYRDEDLKEIAGDGRETTVLIFRLICYIKPPISQRTIKTLDSYKTKFAGITQLKQTDYEILKTQGHFNERFIIN